MQYSTFSGNETNMIKAGRKALFPTIAGSLLSAILFLRCASTVENEDTVVVSLSGYVKKIESDTVGVANVKVRLAKMGISDSTDNKGFYSITATQTKVAALGLDLDTLQDSAIVEKDGRTISIMEITDWIATLPTVYLGQRNIGGKFDTSAYDHEKNDLFRILVIIKNGPPATTALDSTVIEAWHFRETNSYSCFAYFQYTQFFLSREYSVYCRVLDSSSRLIGQSRAVRFNNMAGDIEIPCFNPYNAVPKAFAGADTTLSINDSILLYNSAVDSFGGKIVSYAWDIGNTGEFRASSGNTFIAIAPSFPDSSYLCILRVTDDDGNVAFDTMIMRVLLDMPAVAIYADRRIVMVDSAIILHGSGFDRYGTITRWEWDIGMTGVFIETTPESIFICKAPSVPTDNFYCVAKVTDDDGNAVFDTVSISVFNAQTSRLIGFAAIGLKDSANTCIVPVRLSLFDSLPLFDIWSILARGVDRLDAASDSTLWYCDTAGGLWEYAGGSFRKNYITLNSGTLKTYDIGVNYRGDVFAAGEGSGANYYKYNNGGWKASQGLLERVDAAHSDSLGCHIGKQGDVFKEYQSSGWVPVGSMKAVEVSCGSMIYAVGMDSTVYRYKNNAWSMLQIGTGGKAALVETNMRDEVLVIDASKQVYYKDSNDKWHTTHLPEEIESVIDITIF